MHTFPAMAAYATQIQARSLISPAHLIRNMLPPLSHNVRYYVTNPTTPTESDATTTPAIVPPTGKSRTAPKPTSPPSDGRIRVSGYAHLPDVQPDDKAAASNAFTLFGSDCGGRLPSKVLPDPVPVESKLREGKPTWYQWCNELDDKWYQRTQKLVAEQDQKLAAEGDKWYQKLAAEGDKWYQKLAAEGDKWYQRNQKIAAEYATEIQQKCHENATLTVEYFLPIFQLFLTFI